MPKTKRQKDNCNVVSISPKKLRKGKNINKDILLEDILMKNKEPDLYQEIMELAEKADDDPPVIFEWENVDKFVAAINTARRAVVAIPPLPPGLEFPVNDNALDIDLDVHDFKCAILQYARVANAATPVGTTALPGTVAECCKCTSMLALLNVDPWTAHIVGYGGLNILPVASIYIPKARSNTLEGAMPAILNSLWR